MDNARVITREYGDIEFLTEVYAKEGLDTEVRINGTVWGYISGSQISEFLEVFKKLEDFRI